jgi:hypothetical protein
MGTDYSLGARASRPSPKAKALDGNDRPHRQYKASPAGAELTANIQSFTSGTGETPALPVRRLIVQVNCLKNNPVFLLLDKGGTPVLAVWTWATARLIITLIFFKIEPGSRSVSNSEN